MDPSAEIYDDEVVEVDDDVTPLFINLHVHSFHSFPSILFPFLSCSGSPVGVASRPCTQLCCPDKWSGFLELSG